MKIAVAGATGLVGEMMMRVLEERCFPVMEFIPMASERSVGRSVRFNGNEYAVLTMQQGLERKPDIALFSAGGGPSLEWAPKFAAAGTTVIDNSSAWRMHEGIPLVVPEINGSILTPSDKIIANPNCSTIQMVLALNPLHQRYGIKRIVVSTYQSITGTGRKAVTQLENERRGIEGEMAYPCRIDMNIIPQVDVFMDNGYTKEEMKLVNETRKILHAPGIGITATTVRVPVVGGHSEAINVEFEKTPDLAEVRRLLETTQGIIVMDDVKQLSYPMPLHSHNRDEVFVGRIRKDESNDKAINLWVVADNLRKGAATNAVQIAELITRK